MKKILFIITLITTLILTTACSKGNNEKTKIDEIKEAGKITVAVSPDFPPFEFVITENGDKKVVGSDIYLIEKVAKKLGVKLEIKEMAFDSIIAAVNSGRVDMAISGINPTEERKKAVDFSDTYYINNGVFVVNSKTKAIKNLDDLKSLKLGVQKGTTYETFAKEKLNFSDSNLQSLSDIPSLLQDLKNGNIDAVLLANDSANIALASEKTLKISDFKTEGDAEADGMAIAFKKGNNKELIKLVNEIIKEVKANNDYDKKIKEYSELASKNQ